MDIILKKNGKVFLVQDYDMKGFETYIYLGKDPSLLEEEIETQKNEKSKKNKKVENIKKEQP